VVFEGQASGRPRRGFTLIELLVVVSIIALLISILLPSLKGAREQARQAVCSSLNAAMGRGISSYEAESNDWIPGVNTSGIELESLKVIANQKPEMLNDPDLPVQVFDWMTPILKYDTKLPNNRSERFHLITNRFRCPSQKAFKSQLFFGSYDKDRADFEAIKDWRPLSYLMPVHFQFWGQNDKPILGNFVGVPGNSLVKVVAESAPKNWEVRVDNYMPNVNRVGAPAGKIMSADGTRFVLDRALNVDHDVSPFPNFFGSFTSTGAWWSESRAYGVKTGSRNWDNRLVRGNPSDGGNLFFSYRHGKRGRGTGSALNNKGRIVAVFFDGHAEAMTDRESRKIDFWYPKGARVEAPGEGMTSVPRNDYVIR